MINSHKKKEGQKSKGTPTTKDKSLMNFSTPDITVNNREVGSQICMGCVLSLCQVFQRGTYVLIHTIDSILSLQLALTMPIVLNV